MFPGIATFGLTAATSITIDSPGNAHCKATFDEPLGHGAWDCLGRLAGVALWSERLGGHGCTHAELQDVVRCPYKVVRAGGYYALELPGGIDGTTYAVLARMVRPQYLHDIHGGD